MPVTTPKEPLRIVFPDELTPVQIARRDAQLFAQAKAAAVKPRAPCSMPVFFQYCLFRDKHGLRGLVSPSMHEYINLDGSLDKYVGAERWGHAAERVWSILSDEKRRLVGLVAQHHDATHPFIVHALGHRISVLARHVTAANPKYAEETLDVCLALAKGTKYEFFLHTGRHAEDRKEWYRIHEAWIDELIEPTLKRKRD